MSLSKEVRIGLLFTAAVLIFFVGFYFLKGSSLFSNDKDYYCLYNSVEGLQVSNSVQLKGLTVGRVEKMQLENGQIKVKVSVNEDVALPTGTVASIAGADLLGGKVIKLELGPGPGTISAGGMLMTTKEVGLVDKVTGELTPRLAELKGTISVLDSALSGINAMVGAENQRAISATILSIKATSENMARISAILDRESAAITGILRNANTFTSSLVKTNDTVGQILSNVNRISKQMSNAHVEKMLADLQQTTNQLKGIADKVNNNQGSLGMLVNNKELYNNLNGSAAALQKLMEDIKANPKRYINVSVFGGKTKN